MKTNLEFTDPDGFYEYWLDAHTGLDEKQSFELNARLVMLLANQVGDQSVIQKCIDAAKAIQPDTDIAGLDSVNI
jgi:Protein of unknown function (DUF2783)